MNALLGLLLTPWTAPLSYAMQAYITFVPNADVRTSTDPTIVRMRAL